MKTKILLIALMLLSILNTYGQMEKSERYIRGLEKLKEIDGEAGVKVIENLENISPELAQFIIEFPFGDIYHLDKMDNKMQEVAAASSLIALGLMPQLKVHLSASLHVGNTVNEMKEVILQLSTYAGYPKAINAMNALGEVLTERKGKGIVDNEGRSASPNNNSREKRGSDALASIDPDQEQKFRENKSNLYPEITNFVIEHAYGDLYSRDVLDPKYRQVATIAALASLANAPSQLRFHINAGLNAGLTIDQINGIMLLVAVYAGFPAMINATDILNEVIAERI